jgi:hypothetical protein
MLNYWVSQDTKTIDKTNKTNKYHKNREPGVKKKPGEYLGRGR